jgi:hypothetical protein
MVVRVDRQLAVGDARAPFTSANRPHHQARGFDQAREVYRAGHYKLMGRSECNQTDI